MFVGAYWSQRKEPKEAAAARIAAFLQHIGERFEHFARWYNQARSRAAALRSPVAIDAATIASKLGNHRDDDRRPVPDLGFRFSAWNGKDASISVSIGAYTPYVGNRVVLDVDGDGGLSEDSYRAILEEMVRVFDPDHAVVTSHEILARSGATKPWEAGLFTYARGAGIRQHSCT